MSVNLEIRKQLPPHSIVFDNESFDNSIIGVTFDDRIIYSYEQMLYEYMEDNDCSLGDACDWISYNTLRAIPYMPDPKPMVVSEDMLL